MGIPKDVDVVINAGDAGTAYSGGEEWLNEKLVATVREWIYNGGGFIGVGEPSAVQHGGHFYQLAEAIGVDKEVGFSLSTDKYFSTSVKGHFITKDRAIGFDFGESMKNVYALTESTEIIEYSNGEIHIAANSYGKGKTVYIAGLPYSQDNTRLLMRSLFYAAQKEERLTVWYADNINCEVHAYPDSKKYAVVNNTNEKQSTLVYDGKGKSQSLELEPCGIYWGVI
jgi:1,3-beta-galactosyl-N-acetylhexosamine phosphorylase